MRLCVALDMASKDENLALVRELEGLDLWLKVGLRSYLRDGAKFIEGLKGAGEFKVFLDLKLYDIPNTMADAAEVVSKIGVDMINLHASAGERAMKTVMERLSVLQNRPLVLAVSALTSFSESEFEAVYNDTISRSVRKFSQTDKAVIINEAIELAKELGSDQAPKFINGVLDKIKGDL